MVETAEDRERRVHGNRRAWRSRWNKERNNGLLQCLFAGLPIHGKWGLLNVVGTTYKGCDRQWLKIAQHYSEHGNRRPPEIDLNKYRKGKPWIIEDYWVIGMACNEIGRLYDADNAEHISRCLGRSVEETEAEMNRIAEKQRGFGLEESVNRSDRIEQALRGKIMKVGDCIKKAMEGLQEALEFVSE